MHDLQLALVQAYSATLASGEGAAHQHYAEYFLFFLDYFS